MSCHKAKEEYKPEEADLFLRMDTLKISDGMFSTPLWVAMWFYPHVITSEIFLSWCLFYSAFTRW